MNHPDELQLSLYADQALPGNERSAIDTHLETCVQCRTRADALVQERHLLKTALDLDEKEIIPGSPPVFRKSISLRGFAVANVMTALVFWAGQFLWKTLFGELVVNLISTISSIYIPDTYELFINTTLYLTREGTLMIETYFTWIITGLLVLSLSWLVICRIRAGTMTGLLFMALSGSGLLLAPEETHALEIVRNENTMIIPAAEVVEDTLIILGEAVVIEGRIKGDLLVFADRVTIDGTVDGNLITAADQIRIRGKVGGSVIGAGDSFDLEGAVIGGDLWLAGDRLRVGAESDVGRNATLASDSVTVEGHISRDLYAFAGSVELSGRIGRDLQAYSDSLDLLGAARIGGDLRFHTRDENNLHRSDAAVIEGDVEFLQPRDHGGTTSRYLSGKYYLWQLFRLISAFIVGLALLWLVPALRNVSLAGGMDGLKTAGLGFVTMVSMPVILLLIVVTIVGIPFAVIGFLAWVLLIYLAKIVLAAMIGEQILEATGAADSLPLTLLTGLTVMLVAVNIPYLGGLIGFLLTVVGIGMITRVAIHHIRYADDEVIAR